MTFTHDTTTATTGRTPGRVWTVRLTGNADRTATITCSTTACTMPPRSKNVAGLRRFAALHAVSHAKAARIRPNAACSCRLQQCAAHEQMRVHCAGQSVLVLRHDPAVGRVWTVAEVCISCAPLMPNTRIVVPARPAEKVPESRSAAPAPARAGVPVAFSSPTEAPVDNNPRRRRPRPRSAKPEAGSRLRGQGR